MRIEFVSLPCPQCPDPDYASICMRVAGYSSRDVEASIESMECAHVLTQDEERRLAMKALEEV